MEFRVLGPLEVWDGQRTLDLGPRMPRAVLALLLMHADRVVSLDLLIDKLWGDEPPGTATGALQVYISQLRRVLEPNRPRRTPPQVLVTRSPGYVLHVEDTAIDALRFETLLTQGRAALAGGRPDFARDSLRLGLGLWRGVPYADLAFEPFLQPEIARLGELRAAADEALAEAQLLLGEHASVVTQLKELVAAEPLRERRWGLLALALYRCGRQAEALRSLAEARRTLGEELGIDPGPELRQLENGILTQSAILDWQPPALRAGSTVTPEPVVPQGETALRPVERRLLVGREREMAELTSALDVVFAGRGGVALVTGEPGIGKTRLAEELSALAESRRALVAWGRCHEADAAPAFWAWVQIIGTLAAEAEPEVVRAALGRGAAHIAQIVPDIKEVMGGELEPLPLLDPETARARLYEAVGGFLRRLSLHRPLVVVVDDLHWADVASLQLLEVVASQLPGAAVLVVCTYRHLEADASQNVVATLGVLARHEEVTRVRPGGLDEADVRQLVEAATGVAPGDALVDVIRARTEGNPFFVSELVQLLSSQKQLEAGHEEPVRSLIPAGVRDTIRLRLSRLPEAAVALLDVAAVIGREFDVDTLAAAADLDDERVLELLEVAVLVGVVLETDILVAYRFSHSLVREALYGELSKLRRARLHRRVGEALEALHPHDPPLSELASHFLEAAPIGTAEKAVTYALALAEQATAGLAFELAEDQLHHASRLLEQMPPGQDRAKRQLDVQIRLANILSMTRGYGSAEVNGAWARAGVLSREVEDPGPVTAALFGAAIMSVLRGDMMAAGHAADQLLELAAPTQEPTLLLAGNWTLGDIAFMEGRLETAHDRLARTIDIADSLPAEVLAVFTHSPTMSARTIQSLNLWLLGDLEASERVIGEALGRARLASPFSLVDILFFAGFVRAMAGDAPAVLAYADEALDLARSLGFPLYDASTSLLRGWARAAMGEPDAGVAEVEVGLAGIWASGTKMFGHFFTGLLADALFRAGRLDSALVAVEQAMAEVEAVGERFWEAELHRLRGEIYSATDRAAEAAESFEQALRVARAQDARSLESRALQSMRRLGLSDGGEAP